MCCENYNHVLTCNLRSWRDASGLLAHLGSKGSCNSISLLACAKLQVADDSPALEKLRAELQAKNDDISGLRKELKQAKVITLLQMRIISCSLIPALLF